MKYFHGFLLLLITAGYDMFESVQAQNQSGFHSVFFLFFPGFEALIPVHIITLLKYKRMIIAGFLR
ncbi:hypothetical protein N665_0517s0013 [Sinapis alba]|nr:hypothetical protein N665_0517s0013 [Sinapis alba]